jgi:hypothetical protein
MSQLTLDSDFARTPRESIHRIARAAKSHLLAAAVIAAMLAAAGISRLVAIAVANREVMDAFRETLRHVAAAMGLPG